MYDGSELLCKGEILSILGPGETIEMAEKDRDPCNITFANEEGNIGTLDWKDGVMTFEGEADAAALIFFDHVMNLWNKHYGS